MKKKVMSLLLAVFILISLVPAALAANGSLNNFKYVNTYIAGQFTDVASSSWYASNIETAYKLGLMKGNSDTQFDVNGNVSVAQAIVMASRLNSIYTTGSESFSQGSPWYQVYVDYAIANGIITSGQFSNYTADATRLQFATIFAAALPTDALVEKNTVEDGAIPDTSSPAVYKLYRSGILTGSDSAGTLYPQGTISRAEAASIVSRMAVESMRKSVTLKKSTTNETESTPEQIYAQCSSAVFYIEVYNSKGVATASGSGFFITSDGIAVTNYHVIDGAYSAKITVSDTGKTYDVLGVYNYSKEQDWAVLKINGSGFSYLNISNSTVVGGATVYAIGSPLGLQNTISQGLISNPSRKIDDMTYIQTSASISSGSSGGALINKYSQVIGITCGSFEEGQNLNLAIPITYVNLVTANSKIVTLSDLMKSATSDPLAYLKDYLVKKGDCQQLSSSSGTVAVYSISMTGTAGKAKYSINYSPTNEVVYLSEDYKNTSTALYLEGAGTTQDSNKVFFSGPSSPPQIGFAFITPSSFSENSNFSFFAWTGESSNKSSCEKLCFYLVLDIINATQYMFDYYGLSVDITDFGFTSIS